MKPLLLILCLAVAGCGPKCIKGHYIDKTVPGRTEYKLAFSTSGDTIFTPVYIPEHTEKCWVCDEYESEDDQ